MNNSTASEPGRGLRALDLVVRGLRILLAISTVIVVPLLVLGALGIGTISIPGVLATDYSIGLSDGRSVAVSGDTLTYQNGAEREMPDFFASTPTVKATFPLSPSDLDSRLVAGAVFAGWTAAAWLGLVNLRRLVRSSVAGEPFASENPDRLRWLGGAVLTLPVITALGSFVLSRTVDAPVPVTVSIDQGGWLVLAVVGLGLVALAEIFAEAVRLREFEESTV